MKWVVHVALLENKTMHNCSRKTGGEETTWPIVDVRIILNWVLGKCVSRCILDSCGS